MHIRAVTIYDSQIDHIYDSRVKYRAIFKVLSAPRPRMWYSNPRRK